MKKSAKRAAALALAVVMTAALTGCDGDRNSSAQSGADANSSADASDGLLGETAEHVTRSKVTSADSSAMLLANTVTTWLFDNQSLGGSMPGEGESTVIFDNGNVTLSGVVMDAGETAFSFETLSERLKSDFSEIKTACVKLYTDGSGKVCGCVFVNGETNVGGSDIPGKDALAAGQWKWDGKTAGVSPSGKIVGTYPRTALSGQ